MFHYWLVLNEHFIGPGKLLSRLCVCLCVYCVFERNDLWPRYLGVLVHLDQVQVIVKGQGHRPMFKVTTWKVFYFQLQHTLVVFRVRYAKVVGVTSSKGFLVLLTLANYGVGPSRNSSQENVCGIIEQDMRHAGFLRPKFQCTVCPRKNGPPKV